MIPHETIPLFGRLWWQANLLTGIIILLVILLGKRSTPSQVATLKRVIGVVMIGRAILIHPYLMYLNRWSVESSLPLQMCGISAILAGVVMFTENQWVYEFLWYWGIPGAFHSLLTPEFTSGKEGFLFMEYYLSHGGIIGAALFVTIVLKRRPRKGSWWKVFLWSQLILPVIGGANWLLDANYMYLCVKPIVNNPFIIGEWPWYILGLEVAGLLHFLIVYLPFGVQYRRQALATT
ncbi:MAG: TIGR02206 family membrane protein [Fidelibacterota bacterium]